MNSLRSLKNYFAYPEDVAEDYENYRSMVFNPLLPIKGCVDQKVLENKAKEIFQWAQKKGALYYSFFAYPATQGVLEKQQTFLDLEYFYKETLNNTGSSSFTFQQLGKGEGDGSSFPSGGLRVTHKARAYIVWDPKSEVFLRNKNKVLYIPSLLVSHNGQALDDKTLFRRAEKVLETKTLALLSRLGIQSSAAVMALGLEQQFFIIKKDVAKKRLDIKTTGRAMMGKAPPKHQQFSDHYYGKLPVKIQQILRSIEKQLLQIGVPCKTRHKQVAPNQFEFCPLFEEAGKAIDHNMILMEVMKQKFDENGLAALFHEKPFPGMNGSGKHCNWSLNYIGKQGELVNLFAVPRNQSEKLLFRLFILIQLKALLNNSKLYLSAVSVPGNELRLGGHEAPPRIMSAFLGDTVSNIIDGKEGKQRQNLKNELPNLMFDLLQEDTDRNRTSPFAFTGNKFEFRAVGSSQNVSFPMAVIAVTIAKQIQEVLKLLNNGVKIEAIIEKLREETESIRFEGNGYSHQWVEDAKRKGLYVNQEFFENLTNIKEAGKVFIDLGVCKQKQIEAKAQTATKLYENTVRTEYQCLRHIISSQIVPRCYEFLKLTQSESKSQVINKRSKKFSEAFEKLLEEEETLESWACNGEVKELSKMRKAVSKGCLAVNEVLNYLPKRESWPEYEDFMHQY